jgi:hypothetical protein
VAPFVGAGLGRLRIERDPVGQHRRIGRELRFTHEALGSGDQLLEVLDAILPVLFRLVVRDQPGVLEHVLDRFGERQCLRLRAQFHDQPDEGPERRSRLAGERAARGDLP